MVKTFVLGLGAQKAGTSWFYDWLTRQPNFAPGERKEYNIWNRVAGVEEAPKPKPGLQTQMCADPEVYFDYFAGFRQFGPSMRCWGEQPKAFFEIPEALGISKSVRHQHVAW